MKAITLEQSGFPAPRFDFGPAFVSRDRQTAAPALRVPMYGSELDGLSAADLSHLETQINNGIEAAAREFIDLIHPFVRRRVQSCLPANSEEPEILSAVLSHLLCRLSQRPRHLSLILWLSRESVAECLRHSTQVRPVERVCLGDLTLAEEWLLDGSSRVTGGADVVSLLRKLSACLPQRRRLLMHFLLVEQLRPAEIARRTGWSRLRIAVEGYAMRARLQREIDLILIEMGRN
jgi:hypothetical protein